MKTKILILSMSLFLFMGACSSSSNTKKEDTQNKTKNPNTDTKTDSTDTSDSNNTDTDSTDQIAMSFMLAEDTDSYLGTYEVQSLDKATTSCASTGLFTDIKELGETFDVIDLSGWNDGSIREIVAKSQALQKDYYYDSYDGGIPDNTSLYLKPILKDIGLATDDYEALKFNDQCSLIVYSSYASDISWATTIYDQTDLYHNLHVICSTDAGTCQEKYTQKSRIHVVDLPTFKELPCAWEGASDYPDVQCTNQINFGIYQNSYFTDAFQDKITYSFIGMKGDQISLNLTTYGFQPFIQIIDSKSNVVLSATGTLLYLDYDKNHNETSPYSYMSTFNIEKTGYYEITFTNMVELDMSKAFTINIGK